MKKHRPLSAVFVLLILTSAIIPAPIYAGAITETIYEGNMPTWNNAGVPIAPETAAWQTHLGHVGDDEYTSDVAIGFDFNFYGTTYSSVYLSINGLLSFSPIDPLYDPYSFFHRDSLLSHGTYDILDNMIAVFNDDLTFQQSGQSGYNYAQAEFYIPSVYYRTIGTPGSMEFIAQWTNMYFWLGTLQVGDVQILLKEGTNEIKLQYRTLNDVESGRGFGKQASAGIENADGSDRVIYSYMGKDPITNETRLFSSGLCVSFSPITSGGGISYLMDSDADYEGIYLVNEAAPEQPISSDAPGSVSNGAIVSYDSDVVLRWNDVPSATQYRMIASDEMDFGHIIADVTTSGITSASISSSLLDPKGTYYWKVEAKNQSGSRISETYYFQTASVVEPPRNVTATAIVEGAVVSFDLPANPNGITQYIVTASPSGITTAGISSPITLSGLTSGVEYLFEVVSANASGDLSWPAQTPAKITVKAATDPEEVAPAPIPTNSEPEPMMKPSGNLYYSLIYLTGDGTRIQPNRIQSGESGIKPKDPVRSGYDFAGWFEDQDFTIPYTFEKEITHNTWIYAKWNPVEVSKAKQLSLKFKLGQPFYQYASGANESVIKTMDVAPIAPDLRTLLPIRFVVEPLGGTVSWDQGQKKSTILYGDTTLELWMGKNTARINGVFTTIDPGNERVKPFVVNGRAMLPLRFISEMLGCSVVWDQGSKEATIMK